MIKILYERRHALHALCTTIRHGKVARVLGRLGEPFVQHLIVLIVSALLAMCLGCTLFFPRPSTAVGTHMKAHLICLCQSAGVHSIGKPRQKGAWQ